MCVTRVATCYPSTHQPLAGQTPQIVDLVPVPPAVMPVVPPPSTVASAPPGIGPDPNVMLLQDMIAVIDAMTQVNAQADQCNAQMPQQQMHLQVAALRSNWQTLVVM